MNKLIVILVFVGVLALTAGFLTERMTHSSSEIQAAVKPLDFSFPDVTDTMQSISQWRGKILVINFWATWCSPCLKEIPEFIKLQAKYQHKGLQFVGIAIEDKQPVSEYLKGININYPVLIAGDEGIGLSHQLGNIINAVPFTVIVNQLGQVVLMQPGELSTEKLLDVITPMFAVK